MVKVAVILAPGFEEMEALAPVDLLRRANFDVDLVGLEEEVTGSHGITVKADKVISPSLKTYDLIVIPGGQPGADNLKNNEIVIDSLKFAYANGNNVAAICAGPIVLEKAGLLTGKNYVSFPGTETEIKNGHRQAEAIVVRDGNIITARGAGASYEFSLALIEMLGGDADKISDSIQYTNVLNEHIQKSSPKE